MANVSDELHSDDDQSQPDLALFMSDEESDHRP